MDSSDDPDITAYHLKNRARSVENGGGSDSGSEQSDTPKKQSIRNFILRVATACVLMGLGIGLLIWSVSRTEPQAPTPASLHSTAQPPPDHLNLARSEACYDGGILNVTVFSSQNSIKTNSAAYPQAKLGSVWLHNHEKQQLKITMGNRTDRANWILDMYFLQYGTYVVVPSNESSAEPQCFVDWTINYGTMISELAGSSLDSNYSSSASKPPDMYKGRFGRGDNADSAITWTNDNGTPYGMMIRSDYARFHYWYGANMQDTIPDLDEDALKVIRSNCTVGVLDSIVKDRVTVFMVNR